MSSELERDSTAERVGDGEHAIDLSDRWGLDDGRLNGGYQLAVALRALAADVPLPDPILASASYLRPAWPGPARIRTEVVRAGRRFATGTARIVQQDREVLRLEATFADLAASPAEARDLTTAPDLPPYESCFVPDATGTTATIAERVRYGLTDRPAWAGGTPSGDPRAEFWFSLADAADVSLIDLAFIVDGAAPVVFELGHGSSTIGLTVHLREHPAPGPLRCRTETRHLAHGLHDEDVEVFDANGALVAQGRQLAVLL